VVVCLAGLSCRTPIKTPISPCPRASYYIDGSKLYRAEYNTAIIAAFGIVATEFGLVVTKNNYVFDRLDELEDRCWTHRQRH
jgi:hypothetical protein